MSQPQILHQLMIAYQVLSRSTDQAMKAAFNLNTVQQGILFLLMERSSLPVSRIADALRMNKSSLTSLIDRLEELGLVERESSTLDARSTLLSITEKGIKLARMTGPITRKINAEILAPFTEEEQQTISRFLRYTEENAAFIVAEGTASLRLPADED